MDTVMYILAIKDKIPLATMFKKSYEYAEIQTCLEPLLNNALNGPRATAPQYNTYFPWQVCIYTTKIIIIVATFIMLYWQSRIYYLYCKET